MLKRIYTIQTEVLGDKAYRDYIAKENLNEMLDYIEGFLTPENLDDRQRTLDAIITLSQNPPPYLATQPTLLAQALTILQKKLQDFNESQLLQQSLAWLKSQLQEDAQVEALEEVDAMLALEEVDAEPTQGTKRTHEEISEDELILSDEQDNEDADEYSPSLRRAKR